MVVYHEPALKAALWRGHASLFGIDFGSLLALLFICFTVFLFHKEVLHYRNKLLAESTVMRYYQQM